MGVPPVENKPPSGSAPPPPLPAVTPVVPPADTKLPDTKLPAPIVPSGTVPALPNNSAPLPPPVIAPTKDNSPDLKGAVPPLPATTDSKLAVKAPLITGSAPEKNDNRLPPGWDPYDPKKVVRNETPPINQVRAEDMGNLANPGGLPSLGSSGQPIVSPLPVVKAPSLPPAQKTVGFQPTVTVSDVEPYTCTAEDKSFDELCKRKCGSAVYAQALLKYNRDGHDVPAGILRDPPLLEAGTVVQIPPISKLEERYPDLIPGHKPLIPIPDNTSVSMSPGPPQNTVPVTDVTMPKTPVPLANAEVPAPPPAPKTVVPVGVPPTPEGLRQYQVQSPGEMMFEIAQKTLGDGQRWQEILRLNPQVNSAYLIPAGTMLRLP